MDKYITRYRVETDEVDKGEYAFLEKAKKAASREDYVIEVTYREVRTKILKRPEPRVKPEIKRSDWLILSGERIKRFCVDLGLLNLSSDEKKDPLTHKESIYERYPHYMPFLSADDITTASIQRKKFGARLSGDIDNTTEWIIFPSKEEAETYLSKISHAGAEDE